MIQEHLLNRRYKCTAGVEINIYVSCDCCAVITSDVTSFDQMKLKSLSRCSPIYTRTHTHTLVALCWPLTSFSLPTLNSCSSRISCRSTAAALSARTSADTSTDIIFQFILHSPGTYLFLDLNYNWHIQPNLIHHTSGGISATFSAWTSADPSTQFSTFTLTGESVSFSTYTYIKNVTLICART